MTPNQLEDKKKAAKLQPLPDIQKGIFEIQLAGSLLRGPLDIQKGICEIQLGPFPDLHRAISIFEVQFAAIPTSP